MLPISQNTSLDEEETSPLSSIESTTYFGDEARHLFNQRCQTMNRKSKIQSVRRTAVNVNQLARVGSGLLVTSPKHGGNIVKLFKNKLSEEEKQNPKELNPTFTSKFPSLKIPGKKNQSSTSLSPTNKERSFRNSTDAFEPKIKRPHTSISPMRQLSSASFDCMRSRNIARCRTADIADNDGDSSPLCHLPTIDLNSSPHTTNSTHNTPSPHKTHNTHSTTSHTTTPSTPGILSSPDRSTNTHTNHTSTTHTPVTVTFEEVKKDFPFFEGYDSDDSKDSFLTGNSNIDEDLNDLADSILIKNENITDSGPLTPRTRFISSCIREGLNPRASMVRIFIHFFILLIFSISYFHFNVYLQYYFLIVS